jgi:hypothetical protein
LLALLLAAPITPATGNVITDWDEKAVAVVMPPTGPAGVTPAVYQAQRVMGMVHAAMFDAVNSIERRYRPYLEQLPADPATSQEAAAAAAAAGVLATIDQKTADEMKGALAAYLATIPEGKAKSDGVKLGEVVVAAKIVEARANDGHDAPDAYRPRTTPGVYVPTAIIGDRPRMRLLEFLEEAIITIIEEAIGPARYPPPFTDPWDVPPGLQTR